MEKIVEVLKDDLATVRTGRASPALVEGLEIEAYGVKMRLVELAHITAPEPRQILIRVYDPGNCGNIKKAIEEANLGLTPIIDGELVRIEIPPLTQERRRELIKAVGQRVEGARIMIRQARQDIMERIEEAFKEKNLSEDEKFRLREEVQKIVDEANREVEEMGKKKEQEVIGVSS